MTPSSQTGLLGVTSLTNHEWALRKGVTTCWTTLWAPPPLAIPEQEWWDSLGHLVSDVGHLSPCSLIWLHPLFRMSCSVHTAA